MADVRYAKVDADLDEHPKIIDAGFVGSAVFQYLLRVNRKRGFDGVIPARFCKPSYIARQLNMGQEFGVEAETKAKLALDRCCEVGLLVSVEGREIGVEGTIEGDNQPAIVIKGYDEEWAGPRSSTERVRQLREKRRGCNGGNVTCNDGNNPNVSGNDETTPDQTRPDQTKPEEQGQLSELTPAELRAAKKLRKGQLHKQDPELVVQCAKVIRYLNREADADFRLADGNIEHITARMSEGREVHDFKLVVWHKAGKWLGTDQAEYLRPKTLFNSKNFDGYLAEARKAAGEGAGAGRGGNEEDFAVTREGPSESLMERLRRAESDG